jgi:tetratricopeptide (TPR) repeat protein
LNNLAFVYSQQGRYNPALALCAQAHSLWEKINFGRGLGAVYEVYGSIYIKMERYDDAEEYFQKALDEFNVRDVEWLSRIHAGLGLVYRMKGDRENAMRELNLALEYDIAKDRATILHRLAHIQLEGGNLKKAKKTFEQSYQASRDISDAYHELNNLGDLAMIAVIEKDFSSLPQFEKKYRDYKIVWPDMTYARVEGMILKHLGDLALGANPNTISKSLVFYEKAFVLLAQYETYKEYTVQRQLELLDGYMKKLLLSKASKEKVGLALYSVWQKNKLAEQHPEALGFFAHWMEADK